MNTETMEQFEVMDEMMLSNIEGGVSNKCIATIVGGAVWGGTRGTVGGPLAGGFIAGVSVAGPLGVFGGAMAGAGAAVALCK